MDVYNDDDDAAAWTSGNSACMFKSERCEHLQLKTSNRSHPMMSYPFKNKYSNSMLAYLNEVSHSSPCFFVSIS